MLKVDLKTELSQDAQKSLREQVYYLHPRVKSVSFSESLLLIDIDDDSDRESISQAARALAERTEKSFRRAREKTLFEHAGSGTNKIDPFPELIRRKDVRRHAPGIFTFQGEFLVLMQSLDAHFRDYALSIGATEQSYPPTVLASSMVRNGYLRSFPHHALLVAGVRRDADGVGGLAATRDAGEEHVNQDDLSAPDQLLAPTVCYRCFEALANETVGEAAIYTGTGHCNRNEGFIEDDLTRLQSFSMREIIFFGDASRVDKLRYETIENARLAITDWGLTARLVTASDPFFSLGKESKRGYQTLMQLKYELQCLLPHSGQWISCMSFNNHQTTLTSAYEIRSQDGQLHSGCVGYGLERLAYSLVSQHGIDSDQWPQPLRDLDARSRAV